MKRYFMIACLALIASVGYSQGFFKPIGSLTYSENKRGVNDVWLIRPMVQLSAMQISLSSPATIAPLSSLGTGISYSKFVPKEDGDPYQVFSANLIVLFGTEVVEVAPLKLSIAGTVSLWQYLSVGLGYSFSDKNLFILSGIAWNFN